MTAFVTGTATDAADLFGKLKTFLKTNATLVAASQAWVQEWTAGGDVVLQGPGLSGTDQVMIGMRLTSDPSINSYVLSINGMTGILSAATVMEGHTNVSPNVGIYLDSSPMTYWFVASGRRFVVVVQISTVFEMLYGGLFLPYGTPGEYPYPLCVGGSRGTVVQGLANWTSTSGGHNLFTKPTGLNVNNAWDTSLRVLDPQGQWLLGDNGTVSETSTTYVGVGPDFMFENLGAVTNGNPVGTGYRELLGKQRDCFGGGYALTPLNLNQNHPEVQMYGLLDGLFFAPGFANSAGNIITVSSVDHLVVQNVFRAGPNDLCALTLG